MISTLQTASKWSQILVVTLILVGLVYCLQFTIIDQVRLRTHSKQQTYTPPKTDPAQRSFRFLPDGTAHQIRYFQILDANENSQDMKEVYDVNNTLIERGLGQEAPDKTYLSFTHGLNYASDKGRLNSEYRIESGFSRTMDIPVIQDKTVQEIWRYDRKREIFTGYDRTGKILGCLCKEGFKPNATAGTGFGEILRYNWWQTENGHNKLLWLTEQDLYEIDVNSRNVERLVECNKNYIGTIRALAWYKEDPAEKAYADPNIYRPLIVYQSDKHTYHLALRDPNQSIKVSVPEDWNKFGSYCRFSATKTNVFVVRYWDNFRSRPPVYFDSPKLYRAWTEEYRSTKKRHWTELYRIDDHGHLEKLKAFSWTETQPQAAVIWNLDLWTTERWVQCLSPGLSILGRTQLRTAYSTSDRYHEPFLFFLIKMMPHGYWDFLIPSLLFAAVTFWHGRSRWTSKCQAAFWLGFVLCLNLAGLLTYLALNHTPLIRCASCHKKRSLTGDLCARCHAPLPLPKHTRPHLLLS